MNVLLKTVFATKDGEEGEIITRKRNDGKFVTTFQPRFGLDFHSIDPDKAASHETVKNFLMDVKGCIMLGNKKSRPAK